MSFSSMLRIFILSAFVFTVPRKHKKKRESERGRERGREGGKCKGGV
jgi:hypothetical protein